MGNRRYRAAIKRPERKDLTWAERLMFALLGVFTIAYGYGQILRGRPIYTNWRGLDISAQLVMFLGALFLLVANFSVGAHSLSLEHRKEKSPPLTLAGRPSNGPLEGTS